MKQFLLIPDKFKGSLTATEVIEGISKGILEAIPDADLTSVLASDGGDGFLDSVSRYVDLELVMVDTVDPLGRPLKAPFGYDPAAQNAYVELAKTSGIVLLKDEELNPLYTSTYGTGLQIKKAIALGAKNIYLGIGGSATNDGAMGIAKALGYDFFDDNDKELKPIGASLEKVNAIVDQSALKGISFYAINDVSNPLFGTAGAAHVYARQKGANDKEIERLDNGLRNLDRVVVKELGKKNADIPGSGSAGGTGYGLKTFCNATYISGIEFLLQLAQVTDLLKKGNIDCIWTGEGAIDGQTLYGKLISGVLSVAKKFNIAVIGVCGIKELTANEERQLGLEAIIEIADKTKSLDYNMKHAMELLQKAVSGYFKR